MNGFFFYTPNKVNSKYLLSGIRKLKMEMPDEHSYRNADAKRTEVYFNIRKRLEKVYVIAIYVCVTLLFLINLVILISLL